jgi:hypothetical protein
LVCFAYHAIPSHASGKDKPWARLLAVSTPRLPPRVSSHSHCLLSRRAVQPKWSAMIIEDVPKMQEVGIEFMTIQFK